jgi:hypothetical protein
MSLKEKIKLIVFLEAFCVFLFGVIWLVNTLLHVATPLIALPFTLVFVNVMVLLVLAIIQVFDWWMKE